LNLIEEELFMKTSLHLHTF